MVLDLHYLVYILPGQREVFLGLVVAFDESISHVIVGEIRSTPSRLNKCAMRRICFHCFFFCSVHIYCF